MLLQYICALKWLIIHRRGFLVIKESSIDSNSVDVVLKIVCIVWCYSLCYDWRG